VLREFGFLLTSMANIGVRFGDYSTASRALGGLRERREGLDREGSPTAPGLLDPPLEPAVQMLLVEVLRSRDPEQQAGVARVLASLGRPGVQPLVEVILCEPDFRVRLMAATLLEEAGWVAVKAVKRALATEPSAVQRVRLLEVADQITQDLSDELQSALADPDPRVRDEGFRLFQRLRRDDLIDLVVPYAADDDPDVAGTAIQCLAALGTAAAVAGLADVQRTSGRADTVIACCRALGQAGSLAGVDALVQVLEERRLRLFGHRWSESVRAAAAGALSQISHPRAAEALGRLTDDPHSWVRNLARGHAAVSTG
jgi:HEAT repeat protein